jgi:hypothetical protein
MASHRRWGDVHGRKRAKRRNAAHQQGGLGMFRQIQRFCGTVETERGNIISQHFRCFLIDLLESRRCLGQGFAHPYGLRTLTWKYEGDA